MLFVSLSISATLLSIALIGFETSGTRLMSLIDTARFMLKLFY
jgi:hypothetical protein